MKRSVCCINPTQQQYDDRRRTWFEIKAVNNKSRVESLTHCILAILKRVKYNREREVCPKSSLGFYFFTCLM